MPVAVARRGLADALVGTLAEAFGDGDETVSGALEALNRVCNDLMSSGFNSLVVQS